MTWQQLLLPTLALTTTLALAAPPDGQVLYQKWCAGCHGQKGLGDGPQAAAFDKKPGNLADPQYKRGNSDKAVLKIIAKGIPGTAMGPFGDKLDEAERQALVNYLKVLRGEK